MKFLTNLILLVEISLKTVVDFVRFVYVRGSRGVYGKKQGDCDYGSSLYIPNSLYIKSPSEIFCEIIRSKDLAV